MTPVPSSLQRERSALEALNRPSPRVALPAQPAGQGYLMLRGLIIPLPRSKDTILGRDKSFCDIVLAHEQVSKQHAIVSYRGGRYFVTDLGSLNGTFVNKEKVQGSVPLVAGDEIYIPPYLTLFFGPDSVTEQDDERPAGPGRKEGHFSGLLNVLRITDLIQLLHSTAQSGLLQIQDPYRGQAEIRFCRGQIVTARYGANTRETAVYETLHLTHGQFEFVPGDPNPPPDAIQANTLSLLLEGCRRLDEQRGQSGAKLPVSPGAATEIIPTETA